MTTKANWDRASDPIEVLLPSEVQAVVYRATQLTRDEIVRLDLAERRDPALNQASWDLLRDRLKDPILNSMRLVARTAAWQAVGESVARAGLEWTPDDRYWRVASRVGAGAARAARYAACVLVAPDRLDAEVADVLLRPWRSVIAD
jgi:hypothetical protein